jgi:hypothetical protein
MHCAEALRDHHLLVEVQRLAAEQGRWIDTETPDHHLSSRSAQVRGHTRVFSPRWSSKFTPSSSD